MVKIVDIIGKLDALLDPASVQDHTPNGLQVPGKRTVAKVVTGVSPTLAWIEAGIEAGADLLLCHHGLFWQGPPGLSPITAERLRPLFKHDVALAAYHLPLDAHPEVGNNAILARELGCERHEVFAEIGRIGHFADPGITAEELVARVERVTQRTPLAITEGGPERILTIAIVSGSAAGLLDRAAGCDAFLTGEPKEQVMGEAREAGIHFIAGGHYATETFGVRALGDLLASEFGIGHEFVDDPNPI